MINLKKITFRFIATIGISMVVACSSQNDIIDDISQPEDSNQPHTCKMVLEGTMSGFDDEPQSRSITNWSNGDRIRLTFTAGTVYGDAVYNNGSWTVSYYGVLTSSTTTKKCKAVFFDNPEFEGGSYVRITEDTGIYEDVNSSYIFNDGTLTVTANLKPKTGRIRFAGSNNKTITIHGITHYTSYDCVNGTFTSSSALLKTKVDSIYTPYIYGEFSDQQPRLNIISESAAYTRLLSSSIYKPGESGYMTIPTESSHNGWYNFFTLNINGVEFNMIHVKYQSGDFFLAETETTEQLYNAVMGSSITTTQLPKSGLSWNGWDTFISKISAITNLNFRMPTKAEWEYAAKGGSKSCGYTYSGSNIISNVAWYTGNSKSSVHPVRQLQPNELGFYDMSGNLEEATSTNYYSSYKYWCGGSYSDYESNCRVTSNTSSYNTGNNVTTGGLRLALSIN